MLLFPNKPALGLASISIFGLLLIGMADRAATRATPVYVEQFRLEGLTEEEVLLRAINEAYLRSHSGWWIRSGKAIVALEAEQLSQIDPALLEVMNLTFTPSADTLMIAILDQ